MNIEQVHVPHRLEGETQDQYRARQRMSKRLANRGQLLVSSRDGQHTASKTQQLRRIAVKQVGARQVKRLVRAYREAQALDLAAKEAT